MEVVQEAQSLEQYVQNLEIIRFREKLQERNNILERDEKQRLLDIMENHIPFQRFKKAQLLESDSEVGKIFSMFTGYVSFICFFSSSFEDSGFLAYFFQRFLFVSCGLLCLGLLGYTLQCKILSLSLARNKALYKNYKELYTLLKEIPYKRAT